MWDYYCDRGKLMVIETKYKRQDSESYDDYSWRVCSNKDLSIYDLTWDEVGEILNKELSEDFTSSKWRKNYQVMLKGYNKAIKQNADTDELMDELEIKEHELYKQQVKTRDKLREMRKHLRDEARIENIEDRFVECAEIISQEKPLTLNTYPSNDGKRVGLLQLSDWHLGELVDNFMNTYNQDIFDKRMNKLTTDTIRNCKLMGVSTLKVLNQGDLISGNIHVSTRVSNEEDVIHQTMYVAETLSIMLLEFAKNINEVEFYSVTDNHARINKNYKEHIEKESFGRFIPWHLKTRLANIDNIKILDNKINDVLDYEIGIVDIFHEKAIMVHGHRDKVATMVQDLSLMTRIFPIAVFTGHLHRNFEDEIHGIELIMNPSAVGTGDYAKGIRKSSKARQKLTIYENNNGEVERVSTFIINL